MVRSLRSIADGEGAGSHVDNHHGDEERTDAVRALLEQLHALFFHCADAADAASDADADAVGIDNGAVADVDSETCVLHGFVAGGDGVNAEIIETARLFFRHVRGDVEVFDFACDACFEVSRVKFCDRTDAAFAGNKRFPHGVDIVSDAGNRTNPCYNNSSGTHSVLL